MALRRFARHAAKWRGIVSDNRYRKLSQSSSPANRAQLPIQIRYSELMVRLIHLLLIGWALCTPMIAQEDIWRHITSPDSQGFNAKADEVTLTPSQQQSITKLLG